jgi:16S rRNA processing protein RimM
LDGFLGLYMDEDDFAALTPGSTVFVGGIPQVVRAVRRVDRGFQIAFAGVGDRGAAEELRGEIVEVGTRRRLGEDEYWPEDLIGLAVHDEHGEPVGVIDGVVFGAAQERLVVETPSGVRFEIPFVTALVPVVDTAGGRVEIVALPGLIEP